ncbi:type II toxin-antitoxin system PemK/MazF family toxin [Halalkalibacterium halodurans]|jgi:mRNA interferase MazF|uniref:PpGpp-regulated growth inhibitor (ChpA/MazF) n=2 Tax=Halalkalibacterium halodurans TaxID=86665 RepID=Q9K6K8_HALH5|nr:type II toxin-antitoxin system PemK/MazF family toxin [Halalkalibacterium halodurans]MDY7224225.1 type II toxin-antitoxin system PemK/MazF family toxin [Halalkalibacterium halodurans]MDY7243510.1 type II toxin-antitoxin system PemK/MazF family toxin [Halalkalibacterium halodurans]MED3647255.1 type II toxin-antitoxin system PemK/MazF family toxin [Halalkalibacterium halodurans]MED4079838.1 type II toxin-antitoxin system PemK/MazF family toxin [Halalkalibacterium halodurans]MED4083736.1 type 
MPVPDRGNLVYVDFNPQSGHDQAGTRPAIVLSPKLFNKNTGFAVVCPITRQQKGYPFEIEIPPGLPIEGVILTDQVKSLDWRARNFHIKGQAPEETVTDCLQLIHTFLS